MIDRRSLLLATLAGALVPSFARAQTEAHILGALFPMTGIAAELGGLYTDAVTLAVDHITADKRLKAPIVVKVEDSQSTPQGGAIGMSKLANVERAPYVLVGLTGVSKAAEPIATRAKVMLMNGGAVGPDLAHLSPYFWNVIPLASQEMPIAFDWMKTKGVKSVALVYLDDPLGAALRKALADGLPAIGAKLVGDYSAPGATQQFSGIIAKIRQAKPDVIYVASYGTQQLQLFKQLRDNGVTAQIITYSVGGQPSVAALPEAEGLLFTSQFFDWSDADLVTRRFVTDWRARHGGKDPSTYAQNYYNGALLYGYLLEAIEKAGGTAGGDALREAILHGSFDLVGGKMHFNDDGSVAMRTQLNVVRGGKIERVG